MADLKYLSQEWPAINRRLDEALSLAPGQRDTWLAALVETESVKQTLRRLLQGVAAVETDDYLGALPKVTLGLPEIEQADPADAALADAIIGPYRLTRELGVGGMGQVWLAERVDGGLKRQVALKLPHLTWSHGLAERMSRERDILASLDHPNIARIYDAGLDERGRPYLALEYIEGEAIDVHCKEHALSVPERLMLILQVARAVAHAHARLVVHRDLKPANILVNAEGQVRLLDFGIAKLMEGASTQETQLTRQDGRALTLDYASPEQIRGEPIGTASDVYSLGVVAYELLTEAKPYRLKRESAAALEEAIASVDVRLASTAAASPGGRRALKGDIDAILNKALKKNVSERYPSVEAFAQDIERHLTNLPVRARPDSAGYLAAKFLRRHRPAAIVATVVGALLIAGLSLTLMQTREALAQAQRAQLVKEFIGSVFAAADPHVAGKSGGTVRDLLDVATKRIERELQREPAVAAELLGLLAESYRNLGEVDRAFSTAQRADGLALQAFPADHPMRARLRRVLGELHTAKGHGDEARRLLREAAAVQRRQGGGDPAELAHTLLALSAAVLDHGDEAESVELAREAVRWLGPVEGGENALSIHALGELSNKLMISGQAQEALVQADRAVRAARRLFISPDHPALIEQLTHYAYALNVNGRNGEARAQWRAIVEAHRKIFNPRSPQVSAALVALGQNQELLGELKEALLSYQESLSIMQGFDVQSGGELAIRYFSLGRAALQARRAELAMGYLDQAMAIGTQTYGADSARVKDAGYFRAEAMVRSGRLAEAERLLDERIASDRSTAAPGLPRSLRVQGLLAQARGDWAAALEHLNEADTLARRTGRGKPGTLARLQAELGRARLDAGLVEEAAAPLEQAIEVLSKLEPSATPQHAEAWLALGRVRLQQGRMADALRRLEQADAFWTVFDPGQAAAGEAAYWLARGQAQAGNKRSAELLMARAKPLLAASPWPAWRQLAHAAPR